MPHNIKYDPVLDIIEVTLTGLITKADLSESTTQAISMQKQTDTTRFLLDANGWDVRASFSDIYEIADKQYWKEELNILSRVAVILPTSVSVQEAARFYETRVLQPRLERKDLLRTARCNGLAAWENFNSR